MGNWPRAPTVAAPVARHGLSNVIAGGVEASAPWWQGFYAVLDRDDRALAEALLAGGARALQIRMKHGSARDVLHVAGWARALTREYNAALVINDRLDLALAADADAVHLGQDDMPLARARELAASRLRIGISTHTPAQVKEACLGGADYLGFGPIFATTTKDNPDPTVGIDGLRIAVGVARATAPGVPIVAIGGITLATAPQVAATGATGACVIGAVNAAADPAAAARALGAYFA